MSGRNYVVLGGSAGVGWQCVRILAEEGANVALLCRNPAAVEFQVSALADEYGVEIIKVAADASAPGEVEAAIEQAASCLGSIRGFALTNHFMGESREFAAIGDGEWHDYFQNSLMSAVRTARVAMPQMAAHDGGSFVITTAYSSRTPKAHIPAYAAFKAALNNLVKSLAKAYGPDGVRVNAVAPGAVRTGRYDDRLAALRRDQPDIGQPEAERIMLESLDLKVALGRIGDPSEIADMIVFLLSERAGYTTGLIANVDGGTDF